MGQYAEDIIDGTCDMYGDYTYKYNQRRGRSNKLTPSELKIKRVRKELAILIESKKANYPDVKESVLVYEARKEINIKYGKGWRFRGLISNDPNQWTEEELNI